MRSITGYRVTTTGMAEFGALLGGFRADAMRVMTRRYCEAVADEATRLLDLHRMSVARRPSDANPIHEAVAAVRAIAAGKDDPLGLDCRLCLQFSGGQPLLRLAHGAARYGDLLASRPGLEPAHWPAEHDPETMDLAEWERRGELWSQAFPAPRLGVGMTFRLLDGNLPTPRWTSVRRAAPAFDYRLRRAARAKLWKHTPFSEEQDFAGFREWLSTPKGKAAYAEARRFGNLALPRELEQEDLVSYATPKRTRPALAKPVEAGEAPRFIDHADVLQTAEGRVFVAIMDAGLSADERLFLQISDRHLSFVQSGRDFGQVAPMPYSAMDMLRGNREVTVVEIRRVGSRNELKARHTAIVRDASPEGDFTTTMQRWRNTTARSRANIDGIPT